MNEKLPRPEAELESLAEYYDNHDTGTEMTDGQWVEPPMSASSGSMKTAKQAEFIPVKD